MGAGLRLRPRQSSENGSQPILFGVDENLVGPGTSSQAKAIAARSSAI